MRYLGLALFIALIFNGCASSPSEVKEKVLVDFGIKEKPDDYITGSDVVYDKLKAVGETELKRHEVAGIEYGGVFHVKFLFPSLPSYTW